MGAETGLSSILRDVKIASPSLCLLDSSVRLSYIEELNGHDKVSGT